MSLFPKLNNIEPLNRSALLKSLSDALKKNSSEGPIWVFAYGSLLWDPYFRSKTTLIGRLNGWIRKPCLWTVKARGSFEKPGLVFGLDPEPNGFCDGLVIEISGPDWYADLIALWQREMYLNMYRPVWLPIRTQSKQIMAISFIANQNHIFYTRKVSKTDAARIIADAYGDFGSCFDYYKKTLETLKELHIEDVDLNKLMVFMKKNTTADKSI